MDLEPRSAVASCGSPRVCLCVGGVDLEQSVVLGHGVAPLAQHLVHRPRPAPHRAEMDKRETNCGTLTSTMVPPSACRQDTQRAQLCLLFQVTLIQYPNVVHGASIEGLPHECGGIGGVPLQGRPVAVRRTRPLLVARVELRTHNAEGQYPKTMSLP